MKKFLKLILFVACLRVGIFVPGLSADPPLPPAEGHGAGNNQPAAEAPLDGGAGILFILGVAFAGIKLYKNRVDCKENR
jgi:hypothetical protein